jgi:hypothetical protein
LTLSFSGQAVVALLIFGYLVCRLIVTSVALACCILAQLVPIELNVEVPEDWAISAANVNGFLRFLHLVHLFLGVDREKEGLWVLDPPPFEVGGGPRVHGEATEDVPCLGLHQG